MNRQQRRAAGNHKDKSGLAESIQSTQVMIKTFQNALDAVEERMKNLEEYVEEKLEPKVCIETKEMDI